MLEDLKRRIRSQPGAAKHNPVTLTGAMSAPLIAGAASR